MKKINLFINSIFILFISCLLLFSVVLSKKKDGSLRFISYKKMKADYEYFWDFIYTGYPFTEVCERAGGDLKQIKNETYEDLKKIKTEAEYCSFYYSLCEKISSKKHFGHLFAVSQHAYKEHFYQQESNIVLSSYIPLITKFYENVVKEYGKNKNEYDLTITKKIIDENNIAYIKINSFYQSTYNEQEAYIKAVNDFFIQTENYEHIIIDISENKGGFPENAVYLIEGNIKRNTYFEKYGLYTENKFTKPYIDILFQKNNRIKKIDISKVPNIGNREKEKFDKAFYIKDYVAVRPILNYKPCKDKKFWILISRKTYSASDELADTCKRIGFATLVGENTGGSGGGIHWPMHIVLPNSGLLIMFDFMYSLNPDGSCHDETGTAPDIYNLPGKDALETCLEEIRKLESRD